MTMCSFIEAGSRRWLKQAVMARKVRLQYPGAIDYVMNRGDHGEDLFQCDADRERFRSTLEECCRKTGWQAHSFCLMTNHFHWMVQTPNADLVPGMKGLPGSCTKRFHGRHQCFGHRFCRRCQAQVVEGRGSGYLKTVCDYVPLNPVRAGWLKPEEPLQS